jgi:hypothetical protein
MHFYDRDRNYLGAGTYMGFAPRWKPAGRSVQLMDTPIVLLDDGNFHEWQMLLYTLPSEQYPLPERRLN